LSGGQPGHSARHGHTWSTGGKRRASPTYRCWAMMKDRCTNPKADSYRYYGAVGVTVAERWLSFDAFLADMGVRPAGMMLERIRNAEGYGPGNCRWATSGEQARNKKSNGSSPWAVGRCA
jgi:hypothetical protein